MARADTASGSWSVCPGCGVTLPGSGDLHGRSNASEACWQLYGEVAAHEAAHVAVLGRLHQLTVDTYGAQHAGSSVARIGVAFALIGLRLSLDEGWSGEEVRDAHQYLGAKFKAWPEFAPPAERTWMTVYDVALATSPDEHARLVHRWAARGMGSMGGGPRGGRRPPRGASPHGGSRSDQIDEVAGMTYRTDAGVDAYIEALPELQQVVCRDRRCPTTQPRWVGDRLLTVILDAVPRMTRSSLVVALAALALAGCGGAPASATPSPSLTSAAVSVEASNHPAGFIVPWIDATPTQVPSPTPVPIPSGTPTCVPSDLTATAGWQGATGQMVGWLTLMNVSQHPCVVDGSPRLIQLRSGTTILDTLT